MCFHKKTFTVSPNFTLTWHAGAMKTVPNTLDSVKTALDAKADIFEIDVSFLPDGTPVIIHDDAPTDTSLPTLEAVLELMSAYEVTQINLDLKSVKNVPEVHRLVKKYSLEKRAFYTGVDKNWLPQVKELSSLPCYINMHPSSKEKSRSEDADALMVEALKLGAIGININFRDASATLIASARKNNLLVSLWTPSTKADVITALGFAPDNITSRRPDKVKALISTR